VPSANVGTLSLYYETGGSGPRLLFISGTGGDLRVRPNPLEGPLVKHFTVLAYDQRGLGQSDIPGGPYSMADYGDDAAGLLDALGWEQAMVVGVSFGGMVAQELAIRHPSRVSRLVLACTSSGGGGGASYPLHEFVDLSPSERYSRSVALSDIRRDEAWQATHRSEWERLLSYRLQMEETLGADADRDRGYRLQLEARRFHDTWDRLPLIGCPTLVAAGRYDGIAPLSNSEQLAGAISDARLEVFEGGHLFLLEDPKAWPTVIEFLAD
jgi:3-oxoadipate enol-lactonase